MNSICLIVVLLVRLVRGNSDLDALLELKKGIEKDPSEKILVSWDSNSLAPNGCPEKWYGITCNDGYVTSIELINTGLVGVFDFTAISKFKMLMNLSISNNQLSGIIPKEVGFIVELTYLDLSHNLFTGEIPSQLTDLKKLIVLNLSSNNLEGLVPSGFEMLKHLQYLDLHSNGFSGDIMHLFTELESVVYFDLSDNHFTGSLDIGLGNLSFVSYVQYLNISHNSLSGVLFPHDGMPFFDNLEVFDASDNHFIGKIPSFNFIVSLRILRLRNNQFSGSLPEALLQESSTVLTELDVSHNQLEGPVGNIESMPLRKLNLSFNMLSGLLPTKIGHCTVIDLSNNMLSGNISRIESWGNYIEIIELSSNLLTGTFPLQTSEFLRLTWLRISNNSLEGVLSPILTSYPALKMIDFSLNRFSGFLLPNLFNSTWTHINMSFNSFKGTIPIPILNPSQNFSHIVSIDLSHNQLTGELPPELDKFENMLYLDLSNNHFEGGIPNNLTKELKQFNVSYNNLSGTVPENLRRFPESAFHPGNSLLLLPFNSTSSPQKEGQNRNSQMNSVLRAVLISALVFGVFVFVIVLVIILIYCRRSKSMSENKEFGDEQRVESVGIQETMSNKTEVISSPISSISNTQHHSPDKLAGDLHLFDSSLKFTAEELSCAPAEIVGTSCHGTLYKAVVGSGHLLVVKWLKEGIAKGRNEFAREARKLGNIKHPNLVTLSGYYWGPKVHEKLIISNYIDAPSLALHLHDAGTKKLRPLALNERFKIAIDVARCLNFLHNERSIPHGNLKSSNILIETHNSNALITDYSLHRIMTSAGTTEQVVTAGTLGYRPPEFATTITPCPSLKSDVYAFGVILLELITGKNPTSLDLTEWVRFLVTENRSIDCIDKHLLGTQNTERLHKCLDHMVHIALRCILPAADRPDMKMIFEELSATVLEYTTER